MTHFDLPMYVTAQLSFNRGVSSVTVRKSDSSESPQSVITRPYWLPSITEMKELLMGLPPSVYASGLVMLMSWEHKYVAAVKETLGTMLRLF